MEEFEPKVPKEQGTGWKWIVGGIVVMTLTLAAGYKFLVDSREESSLIETQLAIPQGSRVANNETLRQYLPDAPEVDPATLPSLEEAAEYLQDPQAEQEVEGKEEAIVLAPSEPVREAVVAVQLEQSVQTAAVNSLGLSYTVLLGDTLTGIASDHRCFSVWRSILDINTEVVNPDLIYPGQALSLPESCAKSGNNEREVVRTSVNRLASAPSRVSSGGVFSWQHYGTNPLGCDVSVEEAIERFQGITAVERVELVTLVKEGNPKIVPMKRGLEIGEMLGGGGKSYPNTRIDFDPEQEDVMEVYTLERYEGVGTERVRVEYVLSMPTECCNYALKVKREPAPETPPPVARVVPPERSVPPTCPLIPCGTPSCDVCVPQPTLASVPRCDPGLPSACICAQNQPCSGTNSCQPTSSRLIVLGGQILPYPNSPYGQSGSTCKAPSQPKPSSEPETYHATFTVLGGANISEKTPEDICRRTPDVEYRGLQLICMPDGSVWKPPAPPTNEVSPF